MSSGDIGADYLAGLGMLAQLYGALMKNDDEPVRVELQKPGNIKDLGGGSTLYLPIFNEGAWFSCGDGSAGANADSFRLEIAVVAWVKAEGTGTSIGLATIASGRDVSGVFRNPRECPSTGALELKILDRIQRLVGR